MAEFIHLHNHSDFSLLDGASSIPKMVDRAVEIGSRALALTDHGNMFGAISFYDECKKKEINPIIGCELYVSPGSRFVKSGNEAGNRYYHLILLAKNEKGYKNLVKLSSVGYVDGFYYKPRIDFETLSQYAEGLIGTSACIAGEIPNLVLSGQEEEAKKTALRYRDLFGKDGFYLEIQNHGLREELTANRALVSFSKELGIPLVATNDSHYLTRQDANAQDILMCIGTGKKKNEVNRLRFQGEEFYLKTADEMARLFPDHPEALSNTLKIAEECAIDITFPGPDLPEYKLPEGFSAPEDYLRHLTYQGLKERYAKPGEAGQVSDAIRERADFELETIITMGFTGYFLIVWDYIHWARSQRIPVGPGRGSGAGSIVAYAMTITDIDPLKYNLLFERFLNPERISLPDFDIDFCYEGRQDVIDYVTEKYGKDKVGQIITFGSLKAKAVIRDVARVLDIPYADADAISKLVPDELKITLQEAIAKEPKLKALPDEKEVYKELLDVSQRLEGLNRHASTHAAGVVIGRNPLDDYVPLYRDPKTGSISTQYSMNYLERCGLVKMDFLGLKTLTLIKNTEELIRKIQPDFSAGDIPENDAKTFEMMGEGKSACVFQFESSGMQENLIKLKPTCIEDLIALNALYRPGPMQNIPQFIDSKNGKIPIKYPDPSLEEILKPTYGVIVYQEQVMQVAQIIGGFSLGKADILRRAMSKKEHKKLMAMKEDFLKGAKEKGHSEAHASEIFEMLVPFADYGFNKSHAAAYSILAYQTAFLKAHYPAEFMAANLSNEINNTDKLTEYIGEVKKMGIPLLPPDVNLSEKNFTVVDNKIIYGLMGVKNVGGAAVEEILKNRSQGGPFTDFTNFLERIDLKTANRKVLETLIQSGVFDSLGTGRASLISNLDRLLEFVGSQKESLANGQNSLFDEDHKEFHEIKIIPVEEYPRETLLGYEKAFLGFYFSGHPLEKYQAVWERGCTLNLNALDRCSENKSYTILGIVTSLRTLFTKKGDKMAFAVLEDFNGTLELTFFPKTWETSESLVKEEAVIAVSGKLDKSRSTPQLLVDRVFPPEELRENSWKELHIRLQEDRCSQEDLLELRDFLIPHRGDFSVFFHVPEKNSNSEVIIRASGQISLNGEPQTLEAIKQHPLTADVWKE